MHMISIATIGSVDLACWRIGLIEFIDIIDMLKLFRYFVGGFWSMLWSIDDLVALMTQPQEDHTQASQDVREDKRVEPTYGAGYQNAGLLHRNSITWSMETLLIMCNMMHYVMICDVWYFM